MLFDRQYTKYYTFVSKINIEKNWPQTEYLFAANLFRQFSLWFDIRRCQAIAKTVEYIFLLPNIRNHAISLWLCNMYDCGPKILAIAPNHAEESTFFLNKTTPVRFNHYTPHSRTWRGGEQV